MSSPRYPETFKIEAVKQVTERGRPVAEVDTNHVIAPSVEAFRAELARLYEFHPQAPAFISFDPEAGVVTHHYEAKPEV